MIRRVRKKEDDVIGPSKGLIKWINKFFRFVLYPFIHPMWFMSGVVILAICLVAVPSYFGVEFKDIPKWYGQKFTEQYQKAEMVVNNEVVEPLTDKVEDKFKEVLRQKMEEFTGQGVNVKTAIKQPNKDHLVTYETPQIINRRAFQKAQEIPIDVEKTLQLVKENAKNITFKRVDNLGLTYLDEPIKVNGKIEVVNANELIINGERFFLYGIYTQPSSEKGQKALHYLMEKLNNQNADCYVGAYTRDGVGTVICMCQGANVNQNLVELGYSKNITLN